MGSRANTVIWRATLRSASPEQLNPHGLVRAPLALMTQYADPRGVSTDSAGRRRIERTHGVM
jgi:hypothetical protein